jgi:hypothetical protein
VTSVCDVELPMNSASRMPLTEIERSPRLTMNTDKSY